MKTIKAAKLSKGEIVQLYWVDFLNEVSDNFVPKEKNGYVSADTWGIDPSERDFWKWIVKSGKLTDINGLQGAAVSAEENDITEGSDGEVETKPDTEVDPQRSDK